jgi:hypothetical protein
VGNASHGHSRYPGQLELGIFGWVRLRLGLTPGLSSWGLALLVGFGCGMMGEPRARTLWTLPFGRSSLASRQAWSYVVRIKSRDPPALGDGDL